MKFHLGFKLIQLLRNLRLESLGLEEILIIELCQGLPLNVMSEIRNLGVMLLPFLVPEKCVLRLGVHDDTIKIKQYGYGVFFIHNSDIKSMMFNADTTKAMP